MLRVAVLSALPALALAACTLVVDTSGLSGGDVVDAAAAPDVGGEDVRAEIDAAESGAGDVAVVDAGIGCQGAVACERVVFVTRATFRTSDFGSINGADALCTAIAAAATALPRVKDHRFKAWLGDAMQAPAQRLVHGTRSYVRADGTAVLAADWTAFASAAHVLDFDVDEGGVDVEPMASVWTASTPTGTAATASCASWTSTTAAQTATVGLAATTTGTWSDSAAPLACDQVAHLYCVEE